MPWFNTMNQWRACPLPNWACFLLSFCCLGRLLIFSFFLQWLQYQVTWPSGHTLVRMSSVYSLAESALTPQVNNLFVEIHVCQVAKWKRTSLAQKACWFVFVFLKSAWEECSSPLHPCEYHYLELNSTAKICGFMEAFETWLFCSLKAKYASCWIPLHIKYYSRYWNLPLSLLK